MVQVPLIDPFQCLGDVGFDGIEGRQKILSSEGVKSGKDRGEMDGFMSLKGERFSI